MILKKFTALRAKYLEKHEDNLSAPFNAWN